MITTILTILFKGQAILNAINVGVETAMKIKSLLSLDPDFEVNIERLSTEALEANEDTKKVIEEWRRRVGISPA